MPQPSENKEQPKPGAVPEQKLPPQNMEEALAAKNDNSIIKFLPSYEGTLPKEVAYNLVTENGGFPVKVLTSVDKFKDIDVNDLVDHIIKKGGSYAVVEKFNDIPGLDKDRVVATLIANKKIPTSKEGILNISGGNPGALINKVAETYKNSEDGTVYIKLIAEHAQPGSLDKNAAEALLKGGFDYTATKLIENFTEEARQYIQANKK